MVKSTQDKATLQEITEKLIQLTNGFCESYLDDEYKALCEKLIRKMSRKKVVPFLSGKIEIWAAGVVYALGGINFLFDKSSKPYASPDDICNYFGTSKSTTGQRAKTIRAMFKLLYFDSEFSTKELLDKSPFSNVFLNGMPIPISSLPPELQEIARANPKKALTLWTIDQGE
ncbi:MAG TPA: DUF6398 domain-containing protein [Ktedonobacteraceae bacterium]|nr:DUF6398 domain-containing protein [Ktedonobacteraceae bacterium]